MAICRAPGRRGPHVARDLGRRLGLELDQAAVGGASDGNTTSQYTATLDGLGAVGDGAHAAHEQASISQMLERSALLVLLLLAPLSPIAAAESEESKARMVEGKS
jgi:glutamate carboxypeptidase